MRKFNSLNEYYIYLSNHSVVIEKSDLICSLCAGKVVLDIGCIDHSYKTAVDLRENWLHYRIRKVARSLTGIDILEKDAVLLNSDGWNIIATNAEHFRIGSKFDVINAGDIIEHLTNIGGFLESISLHLKDDGIAIISTPNPFNIEQFIKILFRNSIEVNEQHTVWIDPKVMWETVSRHDFYIDDFYWINTRFKLINMPNYLGVFKNISNYVLNTIMKKWPLFRRDYCVVIKYNHGNKSVVSQRLVK